MKKIFITGVSSGLGEALAVEAIERGWEVYAAGRRECKALENRAGYYFEPIDLSDLDLIPETLKPFIRNHRFDLAILNAGILGEIREMSGTSLEEIRQVMDLNVWANKQVIDTLMWHTRTEQVVAVSSGAAVNASKGWGPYSISKAALNTLIRVYAHEHPDSHFSAIAPGVVMTPMLRRLLQYTDQDRYPSIRRIREGIILAPPVAAKRLLRAAELAREEYESGIFLDVRQLPVE